VAGIYFEKIRSWTSHGFEVMATTKAGRIVYTNSILDEYFEENFTYQPKWYQEYMEQSLSLSLVNINMNISHSDYINRAIMLRRTTQPSSYQARFYNNGRVLFAAHEVVDEDHIVTVREWKAESSEEVGKLVDLKHALVFGEVPTAIVKSNGSIVCANAAVDDLLSQSPDVVSYGEFGITGPGQPSRSFLLETIRAAVENGSALNSTVTLEMGDSRQRRVQVQAEPIRLPSALTDEVLAVVRFFDPTMRYSPVVAYGAKFGTDTDQSEALLGIMKGYAEGDLARVMPISRGAIRAAVMRVQMATGARSLTEVQAELKKFAPFAGLQ